MDAWLLKRFPSRTLDELDGMDWFRFLRAVEAEEIEAIEARRTLVLTSKDVQLTEDEAVAIAEHDELVSDGAE